MKELNWPLLVLSHVINKEKEERIDLSQIVYGICLHKDNIKTVHSCEKPSRILHFH